MNLMTIIRVVAMAAAATLFSNPVRCQDEAQRYETGQIKSGERVLADPVGLGKPDTCTVIGTTELKGSCRPGYTNQYLIRCDQKAWSSVSATGDKVKLSGEAGVSTAVTAVAGNQYGTRDPRTCATRKRSTIDAGHAGRYFTCEAEKISGNLLYLVKT